MVCPILSWASGLRIKHRLLLTILTCLDLLATAWMVLQYSVQVRHVLLGLVLYVDHEAHSEGKCFCMTIRYFCCLLSVEYH